MDRENGNSAGGRDRGRNCAGRGRAGRGSDAIVGHGLPEAVYWLDKSGAAQQRKVSLHAAPVNIAAGLKTLRATIEEVITEIAATRITERGQTRADDRTSEAAMEDRKKEGYF